MKVARMRLIDRWLGMPVCFLLTAWRRLFGRRAPSVDTPPRSILFVKLAEQGSTVLAYPALRDAVRRVGRENVYFLVFAENRPIVDLLGLIPPDNVIAIDAKSLFTAVLGAIRALWRMRSLRLDAAIDLEFFARSSAALTYLSGARRRVGYHAFFDEASYRGDLMTHRVNFNPYLHTSQAFQVLQGALDHPPEAFPTFAGAPPEVCRELPHFEPTNAERAVVHGILSREFAGRIPSTLVLLNANASDLMPLRRWSNDNYISLARQMLARDADVGIAFTGAPAEAEPVAQLVRDIDSPRCVSMAGKTTLGQLLVLYELSDILVTNDSGPAHFGALTGIDVVVLFGPETPRLFAATSPRTHPIWAGLACSPCINAFNDRNSSCRDNQCMKSITVAEVFNTVMRLRNVRKKKSASAA